MGKLECFPRDELSRGNDPALMNPDHQRLRLRIDPNSVMVADMLQGTCSRGPFPDLGRLLQPGLDALRIAAHPAFGIVIGTAPHLVPEQELFHFLRSPAEVV